MDQAGRQGWSGGTGGGRDVRMRLLSSKIRGLAQLFDTGCVEGGWEGRGGEGWGTQHPFALCAVLDCDVWVSNPRGSGDCFSHREVFWV